MVTATVDAINFTAGPATAPYHVFATSTVDVDNLTTGAITVTHNWGYYRIAWVGNYPNLVPTSYGGVVVDAQDPGLHRYVRGVKFKGGPGGPVSIPPGVYVAILKVTANVGGGESRTMFHNFTVN